MRFFIFTTALTLSLLFSSNAGHYYDDVCNICIAPALASDGECDDCCAGTSISTYYYTCNTYPYYYNCLVPEYNNIPTEQCNYYSCPDIFNGTCSTGKKKTDKWCKYEGTNNDICCAETQEECCEKYETTQLVWIIPLVCIVGFIPLLCIIALFTSIFGSLYRFCRNKTSVVAMMHKRM